MTQERVALNEVSGRLSRLISGDEAWSGGVALPTDDTP
jgi:hypothetical protein